MFTGIIEHKTNLLAVEQKNSGKRLVCDNPFTDLQIGESIAVNGVCLTCLPAEKNQLVFDVSPETLSITTLKEVNAGDFVNLERAMNASARFGGHYVSGHVDTSAALLDKKIMTDFVEITLGNFAQSPRLYCLPKGSITLDGVSLTINQVIDEKLKLMLIPHTLSQTTLGQCQIGHRFNVEFDYLTRIVAHQLKVIRSDVREGEV